MPRDEIPFFEQLLASGEGAPTIPQKLALLQSIRAQTPDMVARLDTGLLRALDRLSLTVREAQANQAKARELLERLAAPPYFPAICLRKANLGGGTRIEVVYGNAIRWVAVGDQLDPDDVHAGDEVYLSHDLNIALGRNPDGNPRRGETAIFDRFDGEQLVLKTRDEEVLAMSAHSLDRDDLRPGCRVRWDRNAYMVFEKIGEPEPFRLNEMPHVALGQVGGQDEAWQSLYATATTVLIDPTKAATYGLSGRGSIMMYGAPGCGKTLMVRTLAPELERLSGKTCRIFVAKPAEWESPWVGLTEQNIRELFAACRRAAEGGLVILFLDEVEAVGRMRGSFGAHHSDRALAALLAELDGLTGRGNVMVIAATNRKDLVDPALLERLSDVEIAVRRPDMRGARAIFGIHLPASLPYSPNGSAAEATRAQLIETAVSRFYTSPESAEISRIKLRDGKVRGVAARELASGRLFEQICRSARQRAFLRDIRISKGGICTEDIEEAIADAIDRLSTTLTLRNVHAYLPDLPTDVDVVAVEPVVRKVRRPRRYMSVN